MSPPHMKPGYYCRKEEEIKQGMERKMGKGKQGRRGRDGGEREDGEDGRGREEYLGTA